MVLQNDEVVKVWRAQPDSIDAAQWPRLHAMLDAVEQAQAVRLRFAADRCAYVLAHALRRLALAELLGLPQGRVNASALRFGQGAAGRSYLADENGHPDRTWFFSHSHAREGVLFAATRACPLGIDVEPLPRSAPDAGLLRRYLDWPSSAGQAEGLEGDSPGGFAQGWTALESFLKSLGCGLAGLVGQADLGASAPVRCAALGRRHGRPAWRLRLRRQDALVLQIQAPEGCAAALALRQGVNAKGPGLDESSFHTDAALLRRLC